MTARFVSRRARPRPAPLPPLLAPLLALLLALLPAAPAALAETEGAEAPTPADAASEAAETALSDEAVARLSRAAVLADDVAARKAALEALVARGEPDVIPTLVLFMRLSRNLDLVAAALSELAGEELRDWQSAALWLEARPDIVPHPSYASLKLSFWRSIDPNFLRFFDGDRLDRDKMKIRFEEIVWGGVRVDGIPSLDNPTMIPAAEADYMLDEDLVFGIEINGDARAYPLRILGWHEMFNDTIGGVPVALAYCTLCGAGILFETQLEARDKPLIFGSSGFLYRSNKLMFDRQTFSLWNQFTGEPVVGPLVDQGVRLKIRPVVITSWADWRAAHPDTTILSLETGHRRDYGSGVVYRDYFASPDLMFPAIVGDESVAKRKDFVFGVRTVAAAKAWPLAAFAEEPVINDSVGALELVLVGDPTTRTVRAYERRGRRFAQAAERSALSGPGGDWRLGEDALLGPDGERLPRVPGHVSYWFAWDGYLGVRSELYGR